jgi:hypothetical protein
MIAEGRKLANKVEQLSPIVYRSRLGFYPTARLASKPHNDFSTGKFGSKGNFNGFYAIGSPSGSPRWERD